MRLHVPRRRGGFRLERVVAITLFGVFVAVFLDRMSFYQEYAEKVAMEMTVQNIRTGLRYRVADLMLANRMKEIPALADENPVDWLAERPGNYLGEYDGAPAGTAAGNWYYDRRNGQLVYTVNNHRHFESSGGGDYSVRFRAIRQTVGPESGAPRGETWVSFGPVRELRWQP
jgi:hypothetical protein